MCHIHTHATFIASEGAYMGIYTYDNRRRWRESECSASHALFLPHRWSLGPMPPLAAGTSVGGDPPIDVALVNGSIGRLGARKICQHQLNLVCCSCWVLLSRLLCFSFCKHRHWRPHTHPLTLTPLVYTSNPALLKPNHLTVAGCQRVFWPISG